MNYYGYVYITIDQKENKVYVGQKKGLVEKSLKYFGSGTIIKKIIKKRGTYFLKKIVLGYCYSKEELTKAETECKYFFNALDTKYGYNILAKDNSGDTLSNHPDKIAIGKKISKTKIERECLKGIPKTLEHCKNISAGKSGITFTEEHCLNIALARMGTKALQETRMKMSEQRVGKNNPMYGSKYEWYTNGTFNKRCIENNKLELISLGYYKGKVQKERLKNEIRNQRK